MLPEAIKSAYNKFVFAQAQYTEMLKAYQSSPAYIQWLAHKARGTTVSGVLCITRIHTGLLTWGRLRSG